MISNEILCAFSILTIICIIGNSIIILDKMDWLFPKRKFLVDSMPDRAEIGEWILEEVHSNEELSTVFANDSDALAIYTEEVETKLKDVMPIHNIYKAMTQMIIKKDIDNLK